MQQVLIAIIVFILIPFYTTLFIYLIRNYVKAKRKEKADAREKAAIDELMDTLQVPLYGSLDYEDFSETELSM